MENKFNQEAFNKMAERIDKLQLTDKAQWGKMTVHEMVCHLSDPLRDFLKIRNTKPVVPALLRPMMRWFLLNDKPFPKNAMTVKPYLQAPNGGGTKPTIFQKDKDELKNLIAKFSEVSDGSLLGPHAAVGTLSIPQARKLTWKHLDHHLRQFGV